MLSKPLVFLRDDDVWRLDASFKRFFSLALELRIPVVYGVVPGCLTRGAQKFLVERVRRTPELVDLVQHGWRHHNYALPGERKYEFGACRDSAAQRSDLRAGRRKMRACFGPYATDAFVPPYHSFNGDTLDILEDEGFSIFSAERELRPKGRLFLDLPANVALKTLDDGVIMALDAGSMIRRTLHSIAHRKVTGLVLHHNLYVSSQGRRDLEIFLRFLVNARKNGQIQIKLFSELLNMAGSCEK
ncbi:MAG: DUF2334 domain-containing protein [Candidatus Omnitrophica bacterium]|nr:DUF2334 domain-containing protein [Candidatus Omnitrophota bacterium]